MTGWNKSGEDEEWLDSSGVNGSSLGDRSYFSIFSALVVVVVAVSIDNNEKGKSSEPVSAKVT
jgi:hypothetical protein